MGTAPSVVLQPFGPHAPLSLIFPHKNTAYMNILLSWNKKHIDTPQMCCPDMGGHESRPIFVGWMAQQRKNYGIIGEIRIQRNKNFTVSPKTGQCIENGFWLIMLYYSDVFSGATVHVLLYRRWPLKSVFTFFVLWYFEGLLEIPRERACFFDWFWIILPQIIIY